MKTQCSILLVEDDADDVYFLSDALRRSGVDLALEVVSDGRQAIDFLAQAGEARPRLVILDLNLPHKTGLEVLQWIRRESPWKTIIVIILTSSTSESDMDLAYSIGANSYLIKPSDATKLREIAQAVKQYWLGWNQMPPLPRAAKSVAPVMPRASAPSQ